MRRLPQEALLYITKADRMKQPVLPQLLERLKSSPRVRGLFLTGTTAKNTQPWSDVDIVVILNINTVDIKSIYTMVDGRFADIFFFDKKFVEGVASCKEIPALDMRGMFVAWLLKAKIEYDPDGLLKSVQDKLRKNPITFTVSEQEQRGLWVKVNYNFIANNRYFDAQDTIYHQALSIRLSYSIVELLTAYFFFRGIPWRGEKAAVEYLANHDDDYLQALLRSLSASELQEKMAAYQALFTKTLHNDFREWEQEFVIPQNIEGNYYPTLKSFWEDLVK